VPDVLEEGTYPQALWFVSRAYLRAVKRFHQRGDKVGPHGDLLDEFPYLGPPHKVWSVL